MVLEKTLESSLDSKEIQPVHPKGNQFWIFIRRTDAESETPIFCPPDVKSWLIWKDPVAGKDWRQEEKRTTEGEMVGWHHRLDGHEGRRWRTGKPGVLHYLGSKGIGHHWATEQQQSILMGERWYLFVILICITWQLMMSSIFFLCLLAICIYSLEKCLFKSFLCF